MNFRIFLLAPAALLVSLALFYLMTSILHRDDDFSPALSTPIRADFLMPQREIESRRKLKKPDKPKTRKEPTLQPPKFILADADLSNTKLDFKIPTIQSDIEISLTMPEGPSDSDYVPILKVAPLYPQRAANRNLQGYVVVQYTISDSGQVHHVKVVEARPEGIFNQAAIEAARKFKYKPRKLDGKPVAVKGVKNRFTFTLENL